MTLRHWIKRISHGVLYVLGTVLSHQTLPRIKYRGLSTYPQFVVRKQEAHQLVSSPKITWVKSRKPDPSTHIVNIPPLHIYSRVSITGYSEPLFRNMSSLSPFAPPSWPCYHQECDIEHLLDAPPPHVTLRFAQTTVLKHVRKLFIYK